MFAKFAKRALFALVAILLILPFVPFVAFASAAEASPGSPQALASPFSFAEFVPSPVSGRPLQIIPAVPFNFADFFSTALSGSVPLILVVLGLVELLKLAGVQGQKLRLFSMGIGLVFGAGSQISKLGVPSDFAGYFALLLYGLLLGLVASGVYDAGTSASKKGAEAALAEALSEEEDDPLLAGVDLF